MRRFEVDELDDALVAKLDGPTTYDVQMMVRASRHEYVVAFAVIRYFNVLRAVRELTIIETVKSRQAP